MGEQATHRIVVGVDFTETGDRALDDAIELSAWREGELHPVFVLQQERKGKLAELDRALETARDRLRERVITRCQAAGRRGEQHVVLHVRVGDPAKALHQVAVDVDADLIVVGTHGRRGLEKMLIGSVADSLVRTARLPVLVARPKQLEELERTPAPDAADPEADLHNSRVMSSELVNLGKSNSHIAGLL